MGSLALLVGGVEEEPLDAAGVGRVVALPTGAAAFATLGAGAGIVTEVVSVESALDSPQPPGIDTGSARFWGLESGNTAVALS